MGSYLVIFCQLIFTIMIEGSVMLLWQKSKEAAGYSVLANMMTNPPLNLFLLYSAWQGTGLFGTVAIRIGLEALVIIFEALAYKGMMGTGFKKAFKISAVLNLISFGIGEIFGVLGYWDALRMIAEI